MTRRTYVWDAALGKMVPKTAAHAGGSRRSKITIIGDLEEPFVSPVDGSVIGSRADRREHNRRNNVIDVGNDLAVTRSKTPFEPSGVGADIDRAMQELGHGN